jgi:hypothetical protein
MNLLADHRIGGLGIGLVVVVVSRDPDIQSGAAPESRRVA